MLLLAKFFPTIIYWLNETKKSPKQKTHSVILPIDARCTLSKRELSAAQILAEYFQSNIYCLRSSPRGKSPDFCINGLLLELKTPTSNGKYTLEHALKAALKQSPNIIIDSRYSKLHQDKFIHQLTYHTRNSKLGLKRLLLITHDGGSM